MTRKKILVPFGPGCGDLKSVHHALALAERLDAGVLVLQWNGASRTPARSEWLGDALADVISSARGAGLSLSHVTVSGPAEDEMVSLIDHEGIDLLVLGGEYRKLEGALLRRRPSLSGRIIRVKEKANMKLTDEKGGRSWPS